MEYISKYQTIVILLAVVVGILIGHNGTVADFSAVLIVPLLMVMLFGLFLSINMDELKTSFGNRKFLLANLSVNFVWTPLFSYTLGVVFLSQELALWIGFVMLMVTPCTDWYLVFTGIAKGNVPLSTAALPINLFLQVLLLPVYLMLFFGETGNVELGSLVESIVVVLLLPFILAWLTKKIIAGKRTSLASEPRSALRSNSRRMSLTPAMAGLVTFFEKSQVLFLAMAVIAMFASEGRSLVDNPTLIYMLLIPVLTFFAVTFLLAQFVGRILKFDYKDKVSLTLTTMARNSPIALAIAVAAFPSQPLIALSLVIGPLIELPILVLTAQILLKMRAKFTNSV